MTPTQQQGAGSGISGLAPLPTGVGGKARQRQPFIWRLQQWLANYLPLALMALLALFTTWLLRQAPDASTPTERVPLRDVPDYEMRGFELQRFNADGATQAWVRGERLRHYPIDDRVLIDRIRLEARGQDGALLIIEALTAEGPQDGTRLNMKGEVRARRFAPGADPEKSAPLLELQSTQLLVERDGTRISSKAPTVALSPGQRMEVAGFTYTHSAGTFNFQGPTRIELAPTAKRR
jgi:lipopolysaccharide export system protein LptC